MSRLRIASAIVEDLEQVAPHGLDERRELEVVDEAWDAEEPDAVVGAAGCA
jgi:hypothetical protein